MAVVYKKPTSPRFQDLTGRRFDRLLVIEFSHTMLTKGGGKHHRWRCRCDCGSVVSVCGNNLTSGRQRSCGCLSSEVTARRNSLHGMSHTPEHNAWLGMIDRCFNKNGTRFENWGGRGITVCNGWRYSFTTFLADVGRRPSTKHSLDRKDNDRHYSCGNCAQCKVKGWTMNCRWATGSEQSNNQRRTIRLTHDGITRTLAEWSKISSVGARRIRERIVKLGWSVEEAIFTPDNPFNKRRTELSGIRSFTDRELIDELRRRKIPLRP